MPRFLFENNIAMAIQKMFTGREAIQIERLPDPQHEGIADPGDTKIRELANQKRAIVVTCDTDFANAEDKRFRPCNHSGSLVLRIIPQTARNVSKPLRNLLKLGHLADLEHAITELYSDRAIINGCNTRTLLSGPSFRQRTSLD